MPSLYASEIGNFLESDGCVSVKWLANNFQIKHLLAQKAISDYKQSNKDIHAMYMVSGLDKHGSKLFVVAAEADLDNIKSQQFLKVNSTHIYSIQKLETNEIISKIVLNNDTQCLELLVNNHPGSKSFLSNALGGIKLTDVFIKSAGERVINAQIATLNDATKVNNSSSVKKESAEDHINRVFASKTTAPPLKSKSSIQASSFFNKPAETGAKPSSVATKTSKSSVNSQSKDVVDEISSSKVAADEKHVASKPAVTATDNDEDEEWDDGSGYKVDKNRLKRRISSEETEETGEKEAQPEMADLQSDADDQSTGGGDDKAKKQKKVAQQHVHGAMDDYFEDVAIAEFKQSGGAEQEGKPKRTKKKLVEKMFVDDKGYLVTEMIYEDVTDTDEPSSTSISHKTNASSATRTSTQDSQHSNKQHTASQDDDEDLVKNAGDKKKKPAAKAPAKSKKDDKPAAAPQKNMMSFFGKK